MIETKGRFLDPNDFKPSVYGASREGIEERIAQWRRWQGYVRALPKVFRIVEEATNCWRGSIWMRLEMRNSVDGDWNFAEKQQFIFVPAVG